MAEVELPNPEELRERGEDRFTRRVALVTAVMLLAQQKSSDQWAFYQAKVVREHLYRVQKLRLEVDLAERAGIARPDTGEKLTALVRRLDEEERRYNAEKKDIERDAKKLEAIRDLSATRDPYFDLAGVFLQIAIVMSSVSILSRSRPIFYFSLVLAVLGTALTLNGYFLVYHLPWLHDSH